MLSDHHVDTLCAAVNRIIPPDDFPGGWDGGVGDYLFRQFERNLKAVVDTYARGLDALDAEAQVVHGQIFNPLDSSLQDALLAQIEQGIVKTVWSVDPSAFFSMMVGHCMEGFYSDPGNGGNRDGVAWKMIGFEVTDGSS
jgi:hypothetical protein